MPQFNSMEDVLNQVISDCPYVQILSKPRLEDGKWVALANVDGMLALVELKVTFYGTKETQADSTPKITERNT